MKFDLVLTGGRVIDPAQNLDRMADVGFRDGRVAAVGAGLARESAQSVRDVSGKIVTPGLIDLHTHVYWGGTSLGLDPEMLARRSAVTTLVDAGSAGPGNFHGFRKHVIEPAPVRVLPYINISYAGIFAFSRPVMVGECSDIRLIDARECVRVAREHADLVVGVKVRVGGVASFGTGVAPLDFAIDAADELELPVMAHLDFPPPSRIEVLTRLRPGDVLTHCYRPFPNAPVHGDGRIHDEVVAARSRGVIFDIGHGGGSFGFRTARAALAAGFPPDVISSDAHQLSIDGPAYDLLVTMSKFLCLGMPLVDVVRCSTAAPAKALRRQDLGTLAVGSAGDASVLDVSRGTFEYVDVIGETITGDQRIVSHGAVVAGRWMEARA
ncbi:MAG TPA: amidohydrolase/deacetylase family metallohydrolase [Alphaproteobacteria bacterium]|nr:amidohydrolase/deacetylase family metallohydrolase [Alphaproteobacteria bacterium]